MLSVSKEVDQEKVHVEGRSLIEVAGGSLSVALAFLAEGMHVEIVADVDAGAVTEGVVVEGQGEICVTGAYPVRNVRNGQ